MKPTKAQLRILEVMNGKHPKLYMDNNGPYFNCWPQPIRMDYRSVKKLADLGLITWQAGGAAEPPYYNITPAGRDALEGVESGEHIKS